ncbi:hypothetical protein [Tunicatimonas pelagia]|uniref:hypothetical protein n=1 Tax=Tunicatimonas pelagia TaxID=931531 RepID=UPI002665BAE0|nr:hypothetical protein [Tunicatimonas pelagia]WKN40752.1 hypothetical protein P0M28_17080 [Tunicatimonas pelagia]
MDKPSSSSYYSYPAAIQQRWRLVSINGDYAPLNVNLVDHNFFIYFRSTRVSKGRYAFGGKITQGFWGEYTFDEQGAIEILMIRGMEDTNPSSAGSGLERLFERILTSAKSYELTGTAMKLHSPTDTLEFTLPELSIN